MHKKPCLIFPSLRFLLSYVSSFCPCIEINHHHKNHSVLPSPLLGKCSSVPSSSMHTMTWAQVGTLKLGGFCKHTKQIAVLLSSLNPGRHCVSDPKGSWPQRARWGWQGGMLSTTAHAPEDAGAHHSSTWEPRAWPDDLWKCHLWLELSSITTVTNTRGWLSHTLAEATAKTLLEVCSRQVDFEKRPPVASSSGVSVWRWVWATQESCADDKKPY